MPTLYETGIRDDIKPEKKTVLRKTNVFERAAIAEQKFSSVAHKMFLLGGVAAGASWLYAFLKSSHVEEQVTEVVPTERAEDDE